MAANLRLVCEFGVHRTYLRYPDGTVAHHEDARACWRAMRDWRPEAMNRWQAAVCKLLATGPVSMTSPASGRTYHWPPRWLLQD